MSEPEQQEETTDRGQLVLLAAVALAVTLVPMVLAYLQLGYHDDIHAGSGPERVQQAESALDRSVHDAAQGVPAEYSWTERSAAVETVRERLEPAVESISRSGLRRETAYTIGYNQTRAQRWADSNCPRGPDREFGRCVAERGVVVQERQGRTHVLAVAFDIRMTSQDRTERVTTTIDIRAG